MTALAFVIGILIMVVGLAVSIALHEIGHLVPAKKFGVRVGQYMVGFGPTLWSRRRGETEYGVKAVPLGGYISMAGMYPPASEDGGYDRRAEARVRGRFFATMVQDARAANADTMVGEDDRRVFWRLPVWKRVVIMLGGPIMNLLLAIVLFSLLFSGIGVQQATTTVSSISECVVPASSTQSECTAADPTSPAAEAGLQPGDVILSIDGTPVADFDEASAIIRDSPGRSLDLEVERDDSIQNLRVTPMLAERPVVEDDGETVTQEVGFVGFSPTSDYVRQPIWAGPAAAAENVGAVVGIIGQLPAKLYDTAASLVSGAERDPNGPLSVVGVGRLAGEVAAVEAPILNRAVAIIGLLGSLNIALFVFNLIPLLPLDGGHIAVALWDGIKRRGAKLLHRPPPKPVDATKLVPVTFVVVVLLVGMAALLIIADLVNPIQLLP
ncbi:M50 family metallopeptidase [Microbacterium sp. LRZ72]|uniref:M50 family metallopeptidase n=1 Tax=Microbacterium sp. LRZ72 TaxID=2942481 RepID=UPI0029B34377|nr:M50 family metallopeptidase [Microbacterium sp. LRZ72]MDX2377380.1 M50 family metallopeptidase [Microbacterium sp. LRZ72]